MRALLFILIGLASVFAMVAFYQFDETVDPASPLTDDIIVPSISYLDILNNPEFKSGIVSAIRDSNLENMYALQSKALEIATAANLGEEELSLLRGDKGLNFMIFRAKRQIFMEDFTYLYNQLLPIDGLKQRYPEATDMFARADELIAKRDASIEQIARELAGAGDFNAFLRQAKQQWKDKAAKQTANLP